jgi:hypothetical protein
MPIRASMLHARSQETGAYYPGTGELVLTTGADTTHLVTVFSHTHTPVIACCACSWW